MAQTSRCGCLVKKSGMMTAAVRGSAFSAVWALACSGGDESATAPVEPVVEEQPRSPDA